MQCIGRAGWITSVVGSFTKYALRADVAKPIEASWYKKQENVTGNALVRWPLEMRVGFLSHLGVSARDIVGALAQMKEPYVPRGLDAAKARAAALLAEVESGSGTAGVSQGRLVSDSGVVAARNCANRARHTGELACHCRGRAGANSLTMLRHPWARLVSAYFYKGHSPNYDVYKLRPDEWLHPTLRDEKTWRDRTFAEYVAAPEYQNVMTKMFGDSHGCAAARFCDSRGDGCPNPLAVACHGYRNATYLDDTHLVAARATLETHAFFGLLEAYNTSVRLMAATFGIETLDSDFAKDRVMKPSKRQTDVKSDGRLCRLAMKHNAIDAALYEAAHRVYCERLEATGLAHDPAVRAELTLRGLCGGKDFSDPDVVCGPIEAKAAAAAVKRQPKKKKYVAGWFGG